MPPLTDIVSSSGSPLFMCDFSPPRDPCPTWLDEAQRLKPNLFSIPHLAPHPTRPDSLDTAHSLRSHTGREVVFNIATRDVTKPELLERLARAQALGLQNVVVLQGDGHRRIADADRKERFTPTGLIRELKSGPGEFCIGAVADLQKGVERESDLCLRKMEAGADFLLVQPTFDVGLVQRFLYRMGSPVPMFFGVQVLAKGSIAFSPVPERVWLNIEASGSGVETARELVSQFLGLDVNLFYLIAPIYPGGARDYRAARRVMD